MNTKDPHKYYPPSPAQQKYFFDLKTITRIFSLILKSKKVANHPKVNFQFEVFYLRLIAAFSTCQDSKFLYKNGNTSRGTRSVIANKKFESSSVKRGPICKSEVHTFINGHHSLKVKWWCFKKMHPFGWKIKLKWKNNHSIIIWDVYKLSFTQNLLKIISICIFRKFSQIFAGFIFMWHIS